MGVSVRSLLVPGAALATAGVLALTPAVIPPAAPLAAPSVSLPTVHVENIALAGIGRDIYNAVQPWVQYGVDLAEYGVAFIPYIGPPIADQIGINYNNLIQPLIANTVYVLSDIFADPFNLPVWINSYFVNQGQVLVNYAIAQAQFFGFPPLPPIPFPPVPPLAATGSPAPSASSPVRAARQPVAAAAVAAADAAPVDPAPVADASVVSPSRSSATPTARAAASSRGNAAAAPRAAARGAASVARGGGEVRQGARSVAARPAAAVG